MRIVEHEIPISSQNPKSMKLSQADADALIALGFRFAVYDKHASQFDLEPPYELGRDDSRGVWLLRQLVL